MANIKAQVNEGSVRRKEVITTSYDVERPTFAERLSRDVTYTFQIKGIHRDIFGIQRNGNGKEIIDDELNVSFESRGIWDVPLFERLKMALALIFPKIAQRYDAIFTREGLKDEEIQALYPKVDAYNTKCGIGIQYEYMYSERKEERVIPTSEASLINKL